MSATPDTVKAPELITRTAKMLPYTKRAKAVPSFATAYHYDTETNPEADGLGNLYVAIEVLAAPKQAEEVADLVIESVGRAYYNEPGPAHDPAALLRRFEAAVKTANQELADYTNRGHASWVGRMSAVIAVISGAQLHVTQTGSAESYLYRGNATSHITTDLKAKGPSRPISTFANIASGELQTGDRVLIATPALFHQVAKAELKSLICDNSPNGAVQKLSGLIEDREDADRIAAIVVEVTTSELLALQTRPVEPDEVKIGQPTRPVDVAKEVARPVVDAVVARTKELGKQSAQYSQTKVVPKVRSVALTGAQKLRSYLSKKRGRQNLLIGLGVLVVGLSLLGYRNVQARQLQNLAKRYDTIFSTFERGQAALTAGDKAGSRQTLLSAQKDLSTLASNSRHGALDRTLAKRPHPENDPAAISKLSAQIALMLDQIDGLARVEPSVEVDLSSLKNAKPTQFEIIGSKIIFVDSQTNSSIYSYDLTNHKLAAVLTAPQGLGRVVAATAAASGDGVYLLTDKPSVWLYKPEDNSLKEQAISFGDWPKGKSIASYGGNLYILADDSSQVFKHIPTAGGFSGRQGFFASPLAPTLAGSSALAVDGNIYIAGGSGGLRRFASGSKLDLTISNLPDSLSQPATIHSVGPDGAILLMFDAKTSRISIAASTASSLNLQKQYVAKGLDKVYQVQADAKGSTIYALTDGKLVKFPL